MCRKRNIDDMSSKSTNLVSRYVFFGIITKQIYNFVGKSVQCYYAGGNWVTLAARGSHVFRPILARIYKNLWNHGRNWVTWRKPLVLGKKRATEMELFNECMPNAAWNRISVAEMKLKRSRSFA